MILPTQISLPRNTATPYDRELQQALMAWMTRASYAINELTNSSGGGGSTVLSAQVTVTAPAVGALEHVQSVTFTGCTAGLRVFVSVAPHLVADENDTEMLDVQAVSALAATDAAVVTLSFGEQTSGPIKLNLMAV